MTSWDLAVRRLPIDPPARPRQRFAPRATRDCEQQKKSPPGAVLAAPGRSLKEAEPTPPVLHQRHQRSSHLGGKHKRAKSQVTRSHWSTLELMPRLPVAPQVDERTLAVLSYMHLTLDRC